jgi:hypothetical protein
VQYTNVGFKLTMSIRIITFLSIFCLLFAFNDNTGIDQFPSKAVKGRSYDGIVTLERLNHRNGYRLSLRNNLINKKEQLHIPYPVYRFEVADVNGDGNADVLLGVIKTTRFDHRLSRRLFILRIDSCRFRPLWLGSKVCMELMDFRAESNSGKTRIRTLEKNTTGRFFIGLYEWEGFGLRLINYTHSGAIYALIHRTFDDQF